MAYIYLMLDEKKDFALVKIGYASNLLERFYAYTTHNPFAECINVVATQAKSKHKVENYFHKEIVAKGYKFVNAKIDNKRTEWFKVDYNDSFYSEIKEKGLNAFKNGKNRKAYNLNEI